MARVAFVALLADAVGIAFAPIFVRLSELGPSATAFYRLALPILWLWMEIGEWRTETNRPAGYRDLAGLALSGLFFAGDLGTWQGLGGAVVLVGIVLARRGSGRPA